MQTEPPSSLHGPAPTPQMSAGQSRSWPLTRPVKKQAAKTAAKTAAEGGREEEEREKYIRRGLPAANADGAPLLEAAAAVRNATMVFAGKGKWSRRWCGSRSRQKSCVCDTETSSARDVNEKNIYVRGDTHSCVDRAVRVRVLESPRWSANGVCSKISCSGFRIQSHAVAQTLVSLRTKKTHKQQR